MIPRDSRLTRHPSCLTSGVHLNLRGISAGDFQEALSVLLGKDAPNLSPSVIARLKESWADDYARWQRRDLSARRYVYVWADGVYLQARMEPVADCMLVMIGATPEGKKELLGFQVGVRESAQSWHELLVDLKARGLTIAPELAVADGALGFWKALDEIFPGTRHQRCWFHTIRTQSDIRLGRGVAPRRGTMQRDDMSDLQIVLTDDDPLDDELQDDLPILECIPRLREMAKKTTAAKPAVGRRAVRGRRGRRQDCGGSGSAGPWRGGAVSSGLGFRAI